MHAEQHQRDLEQLMVEVGEDRPAREGQAGDPEERSAAEAFRHAREQEGASRSDRRLHDKHGRDVRAE